MKTITKALIAATLAITSFTATAVDRFTRFDNGYNYTPVCKTAESMVDFINAKRANDQQTMALMYREECRKTSQGGLEFEILGNNRYISKVAFYDANCKLGSTEFYIDNSDIFSQTPEQMRANGLKPPKCSAANQADDTTEDTNHTVATTTLRKGVDPKNLIVCMTVDQAKQLSGMQDGWPKGCFAGAPSRTAFIQDTDGQFVEAIFTLSNGEVSDAYWLGKDNFN